MSDRRSTVFKILLIVFLVIAGNFATDWFTEKLDFELTPYTEPMVHRTIVLSMIAYTFLLALPFVPGVEIGLTVLMVFGPKIVGLVYVCTLLALSLSFLVGRFIPERTLINFLRGLHLQRAANLLTQLEGQDPQARLNYILERSPKKFVPFLLKHRYLGIIVAMNLPGNVIIGGGGGIAMMAGLSRLFSPASFVLTIAIAVSPVPLAWLLFADRIAAWPL